MPTDYLTDVLVRERMAEYVLRTDVPLQLVREERRLEARIAELRELLVHGSGLGPMKAPVPDFTGRKAEVDSLVTHLTQGGASAQIAGIRGMGGVGKTELALRVAARLRERYPDAQLMLELQPGGQALKPKQVLAAVVRALKPEAQVPDALGQLEGLCRWAMEGKRGLLLLDNAARPAQVRRLLPAPEGWVVLVTTRTRFPLQGAKLYNLDVLSAEEAVELLRRLLKNGDRDDVVGAEEASKHNTPLHELAELCGRLPLALRVAAGHLTSYLDVTLARYLEELRAARLAHLTAPGEPDVAAVLGLSVARLAAENADLARQWRELSVFPTPFDWEAAAAVWGTLAEAPEADMQALPELTSLAEEVARAALSGLLRRNLVEYDVGTERYSLHDLLRAWVLERPEGNEDLDGSRRRHAWYSLRLASRARDLDRQGGEQVAAGLRQFEAAWPHLAAAWAWQQGRPDGAERRWVNAYPIELLERSGQDFYQTAEHKKADARYREALDVAIALGDNPRRIAQLYGRLAATAYNMGKAKQSLPYLEQGIAVLRQYEVPTEWLTIELQADRISTLAELGKTEYEEAILAYGRLLDEAAALEPTLETKTTIAMIHNYRAIALGELGRNLEAITNYRRAVELYEAVGNWRMAGTCALNLASTAYWRSCPEEVDEPLAKGTECSERVGELDNLNWAKALRGATLLLRNRAAEAEQILAEAVVEAEQQDFGWNLVGMYVDLAAARLAQGRAADAKETAGKAMALAEQTSDPEQNGWANMELGRAESALGNHAEAETYLRKALAIHRQAKQQHMAARAQGHLGQALLRAGKVQLGVD